MTIEKGSREEWEDRALSLDVLDHSCSEGLPDELNNLFLESEELFKNTVLANLSGKIIEIGSGLGRWSMMLMEEEKELILSDIAFNALRKNKTYGDYPGVCCSADKMPIIPESVDSAFFVNVLGAIRDIETKKNISKEIYRILRPGGKIVLIEMIFPDFLRGFYKTIAGREPLTSSNMNYFFENYKLLCKKKSYIFTSIFAGTILWKLTHNKTIIRLTLPFFKIIDKLIFKAFSTYKIYVFEKI
ncbi:MAG: class I SAM-dependent methyltransferase [bacterium]|nr:class I SAM-dependent methyltransferase [bacterium]